MLAQEPGGHDILAPEVVTHVNECPLPCILDVSVVHLTTGESLIEIIFDPACPLPTSPNSFAAEVGIQGDKFTHWIHATGEGSTFSIVMDLEDDMVSIQVYNVCTEQYEVISITDHDCTGFGTMMHPQFLADWNAYRNNTAPDKPTLRQWVNSLTYLTAIQRWSWFQQHVAKCEKVDLVEVNGLIPDSFGPTNGECYCSMITVSHTIQPGNVGILGMQATIQAGGPTGNNSGGNGPDEWGHDFALGAAKWVDNHADNYKGNGDVIVNIDETGVNARPSRRSTLDVTMQCNDGAFLEDCGCAKRVEVNYGYTGRISANAVLLNHLWDVGAEGFAVDAAYFTETTEVVDGLAEVEVVDMSVDGVVVRCDASINPEFIEAAIDLVAVAAQIAVSAANPEAAAATIFGESVLEQGFDALTDLATTPPVERTGECGTLSEEHTMVGHYATEITPNLTKTFELLSSERVGARGKRSFYAYGQAASAYHLALHVGSPSVGGEEFCCSQHGGSWLSDTYLPNISQATLQGEIEAFMWQNAIVTPANMADFSAGTQVDDSDDPSCTVAIESLTLLPNTDRSYVLLSIDGKVLEVSNEPLSTGDLDIPDGIYVQIVRDENGRIVKSKKVIIMDQQISGSHE